MSTEYHARPREDLPAPPPPPSGWALGGILFAACMLMLAGTFQFLAGLVALIDDDFYVVTRNYTFDLDVTAWGWIHLIIGVLSAIVAIGLFTAKSWSYPAGIVIVGLSMLANFAAIPHYPLWALTVIAVDLAIIWALSQKLGRSA